MLFRFTLSPCLALSLVLSASAGQRVDYVEQVKPILRERCFACHGALKQEGGLRLDTAALAIKGGDSGASIQQGDVAASALLSRVRATDNSERMPPEGEPLKLEQIAVLEQWIAQNANAPVDEQPEHDPREHWAFKVPVRPPVPEVQSQSAVHELAIRNPIDSFIAAEQLKQNLNSQPEADKRVWLRRVSLDLIGLPPTVAELDAFIADTSPEAHDKVVSRLLDNPQYGQRWGRHWMDIWRYSDWWGLGAEVRNSQKHMWHWRDWIVDSMNSDKPYDQMLREMLAADELYPNDLDRLRATGYLARQYFIFNRTTWLDEAIEHTAKGMLGLTFNCAKCHDHKYDPLTQVEYYNLRAIFEPYQVRMEMVPGQNDFEKDGIPRAFDAHLDVATYLHLRGDDRTPDQSRAMEPKVPGFLNQTKVEIEPVELPPEAVEPGLREFVLPAHRDASVKQIAAARSALESASQKLAVSETAAKKIATKSDTTKEAETPVQDDAKSTETNPPIDELRLAMAIAEKALKTAEAQLASIEARAAAGQAKIAQAAGFAELAKIASKSERIIAAAKADEEVSKAELALLKATTDQKSNFEKKLDSAKAALDVAVKAIETPSETFTFLPGAKKTQEDYQNRNADVPYPSKSTGRRTAFIKWLTYPNNPLPARVAINHIWARHMGQPLVPTVFDFGRKGTPPTHPELLDWLAVEFVESGWSMKHIHRLIVTSGVYRLSSSSAEIPVGETVSAAPSYLQDPDNRYYWRMNPVRIEAQIVRDSLLSLAGELDVRLEGPSIAVDDEGSRRRSLYFVHSHNNHNKFLSTFDDANVLDCYRRAESIVPQQALALENSPLAMLMAGKIALNIESALRANDAVAKAIERDNDADFVRLAFVWILSVEPSADEQTTMLELLRRMIELANQKQHPNPVSVARTNLVLSILNHNDFITVR